MRKIIISFPLALLLALLVVPLASADTITEAASPDALCMPGIYLNESPECSVMGPAAYLTRRAEITAEIATQAERFPHIDESYGETDLNYFKVSHDNGPIFSSFDSAVNNTGAIDSLPNGYTFASYTKWVASDGQDYFQLPTGNWMRGSSVAAYAHPSRFLGVLPPEQPTRKFGWVIREIPTQTKPGFYQPLTGHTLYRYTLIEVFDEIKIGSSMWYMIAPDEWVHNTQVALVYPAEQPPEGVTNGRWIEINIWEQTLSVYENNQLLFATLITTGSKDSYTRPGLFKIYEQLETTNMAGFLGKEDAYYLMDVLWTQYFDDGRGLHAEYWHDHLGYRSSHGCVNMSFPDAEWVFDWAQMGDWVFAWDASGQTPVEPKLFTQFLDD
ncbi:MAG: L,D-transpeptidase [Anaerolineales bacterium]